MSPGRVQEERGPALSSGAEECFRSNGFLLVGRQLQNVINIPVLQSSGTTQSGQLEVKEQSYWEVEWMYLSISAQLQVVFGTNESDNGWNGSPLIGIALFANFTDTA